MDNGARPFGAIDLRGCPNGETDATVTEERFGGAAVAAEVEVDVGTVLVRAREAILRAERVAICGTQVIDHHDDAGTGVAELVAGRVGLTDEFPACTARGSLTGTGSHTVQVLAHRRAEAGGRVEEASSSVGVAIGRAEAVSSTIMGHGCLEGRA